MRKFEVRIYHSSFCTYEVEAENSDEAILKAKKLQIDENEIMSNLEEWSEANEAIKISENCLSTDEKGSAFDFH